MATVLRGERKTGKHHKTSVIVEPTDDADSRVVIEFSVEPGQRVTMIFDSHAEALRLCADLAARLAMGIEQPTRAEILPLEAPPSSGPVEF